MRPRFSLLVALAVLLLAPAVASAAPTLYACTPSGQILTYTSSTQKTELLFTGTGQFVGPYHDCVVGPDGSLYIAASTRILRVNPLNTSQRDVITPALPSAARAVAFNVRTLYINTVDQGVFKLAAQEGTPLDFTNASLVSLLSLSTSGQGVVFDARGNLVIASGSQVLSDAAPLSGDAPYGPATSLVGGVAPVGTAVNTCRETVFADTTTDPVTKTRSIKRATSSGAQTISGLTFSGKDIPLYIEIDSSNDMFIITGEDLAGSNAKFWKADFTNLATCSSATKSQLVELKTKLSGPDKIVGLASASAMGIALPATDSPTLQQSFTSADCNVTKKLDFGYHAITVTFTDCATVPPPTTTFNVTAIKSRPADVNFNTNFPTPTEGMRYSPMGGFVTQYVIEPSPAVAGHPLRLVYQFFTQEAIATPGVAKVSNPNATTYTENVGNEFWDAGILDPPAGERGDACCSKRVVFNTPAQNNNACTLSFGTPFQPGGVQNPQFNSGQNLTLNVNVQGGCTGGELRVSIFRGGAGGFGGFEPITVTSNVQQDNKMDPNGPSSFKYGVNTDNFAAGQYRVTVWGTVGAPISHDFTVDR